mgnify:FL=1
MRNQFDLSHYSFMAGKIGMLQTLSVIPVIAGDSISLRTFNQFRLSPLRRSMSVDAQVDLFAFYVPHRHIYGTDWTDMIKNGVDDSTTVTTITAPSHAQECRYFGGGAIIPTKTYPLWRIVGYNMIWDRYFRHLKLTPSLVDADSDWLATQALPSGHTSSNSPLGHDPADTIYYGFPCARLKTPWSTGITSGIDSSDYTVPSTTTMDIRALEQIKMRYKTEVQREWFTIRYNDILKGTWGSGVNIDADQRPELIMRKTSSLSGYDVDGTGDANLGTHAGKSISNNQINVPRKFIPEHGALWLMALVRFPTMVQDEIHPLSKDPTFTYTSMMADPHISRAEPPFDDDTNRWFETSSGTDDLGTVPFGQEFRYQPNAIHNDFDTVNGYPWLEFASSSITDRVEATYISPAEYDDVFSTTQLGHWQTQTAIACQVLRNFPTARESLFAGTYKS